MPSSLPEWLFYIESLHYNEIHLGLRRIKKVYEALKPGIKSKIITVAGTNGKGSLCTLLSNCYVAAGYNVGLYTSPHLYYFNERIKINNIDITDQELCELFIEIEQARFDVYLSLFEWLTLAALLYFARHDLDLVILEVGMGGRLDATNILDPDLAIITAIDYDHQIFLGNDKAAIAFEKFGIIKPGCEFIWGEASLNYLVAQWASVHKTSGVFFKRDYDLCGDLPSHDWHPAAVAHAQMTIKLLQKYFIVPHEIFLTNVINKNIMARQDIFIHDNINVLIDVAHNAQAAKYLSQKIMTLTNSNTRFHIIFSCLNDKDAEGMLINFKDINAVWYLIDMEPYVKRALAIDKISTILNKYDMLMYEISNNVEQAWQKAKSEANLGDWIVVFGSFSVAGPLLKYLKKV